MAFPTTAVLDDFSGTLANWTNSQLGDGALAIVSSTVTGPAGVFGGAVRTATFGPDMEAYATVVTLPGSGEDMAIWARVTNSGGSPTGYNLTVHPVLGTWQLWKIVAGVNTSLATGSQAISAGDAVGISVVGTTVTAYYKAAAGAWGTLTAQTDAGISGTGQIGLELFSNVGRLDNFGGGTAGSGVQTALLKWSPPGWNGGDVRLAASFPGYTAVTAPAGPATLTLTNGVDYYVTLGAQSWSSVGGIRQASSLTITGGRNVVIIGGSITNQSTNSEDDILGLLIDGGDASGIVHIEGVHWVQSVNALTLRTPRLVRVQYCRVSNNHVYQDHYAESTPNVQIHPDVIQIWGTTGIRLQTDHFTAYSDFTGLSVLGSAGANPDPTSWERYNVDMHGNPPQNPGDLTTFPLVGGAIFYPASGGTAHSVCAYTGTELWADPGWYDPTTPRNIDNVCGYTDFNTYKVYDAGNVLRYTSAVNQVGGGSGRKTQGDQMVWLEGGMQGESWRYGKPTVSDGADPNGNFVPAAAVGTAYVPVGYITAAVPVNTVAPAVTGTVTKGQTLATTDGTWTGPTPITFTYQWQRDVAGNGVFSNIAAATANSYPLVAADVGNNVRCRVTGTNANGPATASSNVVGLVGSVPANTVAPTVSTPSLVAGPALVTVVQGTWTGSPTPALTNQWQKDTAGNSVFVNIAGQTGPTYTPVDTDAASFIRCQVTGTNSAGSAQANSNAVGPIVASPPPPPPPPPPVPNPPPATPTPPTSFGSRSLAYVARKHRRRWPPS